jgi:hypothetical protein
MSFKKNIKFSPVIVHILIFINILITGGKDLFHNHELDLNEHENCPVYILNTNAQTDEVVHYDFEQITTVYAVAELLTEKPQISELILYFHLRAPPTFPKIYC